MSRELPTLLAPATGVIAFGTCLAMVGLHLYGASLPRQHVAQVEVEVPASPDEVWALLSDPSRRPEWRPRVVAATEVDAAAHVWTEIDTSEDRFDFVVVSAEPRTFVMATARPEDIGMYAEWRWTVTPGPDGGSRITAREEGAIKNDLVRGYWALWTGPYAGIEPDLKGLAERLGGTVDVRRTGPTTERSDP